MELEKRGPKTYCQHFRKKYIACEEWMIYNPNASPSNLGFLSNEAIKDKSGIRSLGPNFSF